MPLFGFKTIDAGEQALVRNHLGVAKVVSGPARVTLWRSKVETLQLFYAGEGQYLEVNQRTGPRLCLSGPTQLYLNPIEHESIHIKEAILVSANEALVVYSAGNQGEERIYSKIGEEKENSFERKVLYGPIRYIPKPSEWIHEFSWHGEDPTNKTQKVRGALKFKLLRVIADQFYYNVPEVRTKDDTQITVKLMVFFELVDVVKMLDNTHDPIADFINAVCSDTIQYCSGLSYEEFVENTSKMNELSTFKQLTSRSDNIGYRVNKVVFRGFHSSDALQNMHDKAIHERTRLRLEAETEDHRQKTLDLQLIKEEERSTKQRELEREREEHKRSMEREKHAEKLRLDAAVEDHKQKQMDLQLLKEAERSERQRYLEKEQDEHRRQMEREAHKDKMIEERELAEATVDEKKMMTELQREKVKIEKERLDGLKALEVDVTQVLIAECKLPDKTLRVESNDGTTLHLHDDFNKK
jgi:hypothetical protein